MSSGISSKIMEQARLQQREILHEAQALRGDPHLAFSTLDDTPKAEHDDDGDSDIDEFAGFSETLSLSGADHVTLSILT